MLNFYNYYGKMHPELIKRLKDIESKLQGTASVKSNVLIIRNQVTMNEQGSFREGETLPFSGTFNSEDETITITEDMMYHIIKDIDIIVLYYSSDSTCNIFYKKDSSYNMNYATFVKPDGRFIDVGYCKLTYHIPE